MSQVQNFEEQVAVWLFKYKIWIVSVLALMLLGTGGYFLMDWLGSHKEALAREDIASAELSLNKKREEEGKKTDKSAQSAVDFDRDYKTLVDAVQKSILAHKDTKAALSSALELSQFVVEQKKPALGIEALEKTLGAAKPTELLFVLGKFQLANLYGMANQYDHAQQYYSDLLKTPAAQFMTGEILLRLGLCAQKLGQKDQAKDYFNRVVLEYSDTEAAASAKTFLRLMRLGS